MNKITKKHVIKFLSLFTFMLFSCRGLFDSQKIESKQEGPFVVTGRISNSMDSSASGARTASSSKNESEKFWYKVTATPSEPTLEVKETIVSSKDYSFVLDKGTWTFYVEAYLVATSDEITDSTIPILVSNNLEYNINSSSVTLPSVELKMNTAANATGTFSLPIDVTGTGIESCKVEFTNILDGIKPDGFTKNADTVSETGSKIITLQPGSNISAGYYLMRMEFYSGSDGTGIRLYSRTEMITIYPGASSTSYVVKWNNENNLLEITTSLIEGNRNHEVYVNSAASVSGSGGFFDPFNTFTQAMDYINTVNDGNDANIDYSIILCSDITGASASGSDTFIEFEPHHPINLTIKSKTDSEIYKIQPTESSCGISFKGVDGGACLFTLQNVAITGYGTSTDNTAHLGAYVYENATVQLTGATYIDYIAVENDAPVIKIPSELEKIYKTADNKYSIEETGNTLLKNFIYVPQTSYAEDKQYLSGDGLATSCMNIGIKDQQLDDSKKQKWEFLSTGYIQKFFLYAKNLTSIPAAGDTVYIKDAADLYALQTLVNSGYLFNADGSKNFLSTTGISFENVTFEQLEDIDLTTNDNTKKWVPIGTTEGYTTKWFKGTYNGNGNQISNLNINATTDIAPALFGNVQNGTIQNVIVSGSVVCSSGDYVAGLVNCLVSGTLENCVSNVNVKNTSAYTTSITGGIVASVKGGSKVLNCTNNGSIENTGNSNFAGGIAGVSDSTSTNLFINCKNNGSVITSSTDISSSAGGIISTNKGQLNIFNCINYGKIETKNNAGYGGGILGANRTESYRVNIYNCVNNASVNNFSGNYGIIGYIQANSTIYVKYCYNNSSKVSELFDTTSSITSENNQNTSFTEGYEESIVTELNANISKFSDLYGYEYCHNWAYESAKGLYLVPPPVVANPPIAGHTYASTMASAPSSGTVYIRESADLQQISNWSQSSTLENVTFVMDYDVSLDGIEWIPIGNVSNPFGGSFDGNNKSIINFNNDSAGDGFALFNRATNASLKNIDISGQITVTTDSSPYSAGIVAMADGCIIENCKSNVNITSAIEGSCIAGIAANLTGSPSTISNCLNLGTMDISKKTSKAGGIVAYVSINNNTTFIRNVENKGGIKHSGTATTSINLGGVVGFADTNSGGVIVIENSGNKGSITSNAKNSNASVGDSSKVHAGGIIGFESYSKADNKVLNCFNVGQISGANINAAIVATGSTTATIEYCYFDSTKCEMWKDSSKEETDTVKKTYADSGYNVSITVNSTDCHYVTTALNTWIQSQSDSSLYTNWNNINGDNSATGYGEPVLPIEQTP